MQEIIDAAVGLINSLGLLPYISVAFVFGLAAVLVGRLVRAGR